MYAVTAMHRASWPCIFGLDPTGEKVRYMLYMTWVCVGVWVCVCDCLFERKCVRERVGGYACETIGLRYVRT